MLHVFNGSFFDPTSLFDLLSKGVIPSGATILRGSTPSFPKFEPNGVDDIVNSLLPKFNFNPFDIRKRPKISIFDGLNLVPIDIGKRKKRKFPLIGKR